MSLRLSLQWARNRPAPFCVKRSEWRSASFPIERHSVCARTAVGPAHRSGLLDRNWIRVYSCVDNRYFQVPLSIGSMHDNPLESDMRIWMHTAFTIATLSIYGGQV